MDVIDVDEVAHEGFDGGVRSGVKRDERELVEGDGRVGSGDGGDI